MKTRYILILITFSTLIALFSCETTEKIDDFPLRPAKLVVNSFFTEGREMKIQVSKSLSVLDNADLKLIDDAEIKIYRGTELINSIEGADPDGLYTADGLIPEADVGYRIEVLSPGFERAAGASSNVPRAVKIEDVSYVISESTIYEGTNSYGYYYGGTIKGSMNVFLKDPPERDNYYYLSAVYYDTVYQSPDSLEFEIRMRHLSLSSDDGAISKDGSVMIGLFFTDDIFNGQNYSLKVDFEDGRGKRGRVYHLELVSFSKAAYLYRITNNEFQKSRNDPFSEPVQVYSNIENGYGIFAGYSVDVYEVVMVE